MSKQSWRHPVWRYRAWKVRHMIGDWWIDAFILNGKSNQSRTGGAE